MTDHTWEPNPDWQRLDSPAEGDIVQFKLTSTLSYRVNVIVASVDEDNITGIVEIVSDWYNPTYQITGGDILSLVGKKLTFKKHLMQNIIKKPTHLK
jgi:hypothetical protein